MSHKPPVDTSAEQRTCFRIDTVLRLSFRLEGELAQPLPQPTPVNLSSGGAGLLTDRSLALGDSLVLTLFLPSGPPIQTHAKVVRSALIPKLDMALTRQIGLQFLALDEKDQERLNQYVFHLQIERRRTRCHL
nr:PilZ domain-containing protein [Nitrospirota bacterium]